MLGKTALVYAGKGSSHSWVWLADLFEANGVLDARFVDSTGFARGLEDSPSLVVVSGGDGFGIASTLSGKGFDALKEFIGGGGRYLGICAGAYLPLPSRIEPFCRLNLSQTKIRNTRDTPAGQETTSPRIAVRYGSCSIYHPVRGEVLVGDGNESFIAPIYGGPVFCEPAIDRAILRYRSFTSGTVFQVERSSAEQTMIGQPAVVRCDCGEGRLILAGPHLEHPGYRRANDVFLCLAGLPNGGRVKQRHTRVPFNDETLARSLADLKVAVLGMENESFVEGAKQWDGGRMLELAGAIEKRKGRLDRDTTNAVTLLLDRCRENLMSAGYNDPPDADSTPELLVEAARIAIDSHFRAARDGFILADSH